MEKQHENFSWDKTYQKGDIVLSQNKVLMIYAPKEGRHCDTSTGVACAEICGWKLYKEQK